MVVTVQKRRPKYASHVLPPERLDLDSCAVLVDSETYLISDRKNGPYEQPEAKVSVIEYNGTLQLRLAIRGNKHLEKPSYYVNNPEKWVEWCWITIPVSELEKLKKVCKKVITGKTNLAEVLE